MSEYPDRYVITGIVAEGEKAGLKVWLYWDPEGGGWWQWGPEGWAERFEAKEGRRYDDAIRCAPKTGPWYYYVDPATVKTEAVPAIVKVY
jgi:hypothetical protein